MKILALSDWRTNPLEDIEQIILKTRPDLIAYCGDDINRFREIRPDITEINSGATPPEDIVEVSTLLRGVSWSVQEKLLSTKKDLRRLRKFLEMCVRAKGLEQKCLVDAVFCIVKKTKAPDPMPPKAVLRVIESLPYFITRKVKELPKRGEDYVRRFITGMIQFWREMVEDYKKDRVLIREIPSLAKLVFHTPLGCHDIIHKGQRYQVSLGADLVTFDPHGLSREVTHFKSWGELPKAPVELNLRNSATGSIQIESRDPAPPQEQVSPPKPAFPKWKEGMSVAKYREMIIMWREMEPPKPPVIRIQIGIEAINETSESMIRRWLELLPRGFHYVPGNDDYDTYVSLLAHNLDESNFEWDNWVMIGIGRSPGDIGYECYKDSDMYPRLRERVQQAGDRKIILVAHAPPLGSLDLSRRFTATHIGSEAIRKVVEEFSNIEVVLCGHSHYWGGMQCTLNRAQIVNVANDDFPPPLTSRYAIVNITLDGVKIEQSEYGINWREVYRLGAKCRYLPRDNIPSMQKLNRIKELGTSQLKKRIWLYMQFLTRGKASIKDIVQIEDRQALDAVPSNAIYLDVETESFTAEPPNFLASIALVHGDSGESKFFHVKNYKNCADMVRNLEKYLLRHKGKSLYAWSSYDAKVLADYAFRYAILDIIPIIRKAVILPGYRLKNVLKYLGIPGPQIPLDDGKYWGILIEHLLKSQESCTYCSSSLTDLETYNMHDARAIKLIVDVLKSRKGS